MKPAPQPNPVFLTAVAVAVLALVAAGVVVYGGIGDTPAEKTPTYMSVGF